MNATDKDGALVFLRGALGDTLLALPALSGLPRRLNVSNLTLVGHPSYLALLANQPFVGHILDHSRSDWSGLYADPPHTSPWLKKILQSHAGGVVLARRIPDPAAGGLEALGLSPVLTAASWPEDDREEHVVHRMCRGLGVPVPDPLPVVVPSEEGLGAAEQFLTAHRLNGVCPIVLHPGSGGRRKNWPLANWVSLAQDLVHHRRVLFLAGPAEEAEVDRLKTALGPTIPVAENLPLPAVAGLIASGCGYIGHDSGVSHLSALMGRPTVVLFGPTRPAHWAPLGPAVRILAPPENRPDPLDWNWLEPQKVVETLKELMTIPRS